MTKERRGEIGWKLHVDKQSREPSVLKGLKRHLGNTAKRLDVPKEELMEFLKMVMDAAFENEFGSQESPVTE